MAESTLSLTYSDLAGEVGVFMGWGRGGALGDPSWTTQQQASIVSCVGSGLRQFYFPPPTQDQPGGYDWSFLKPVASLALPSGQTTLQLPDDFGGFEGQLTVQAAAAQSYWPVDVVGVGQVYARASQQPQTTGRPLVACQEPLKGTHTSQGQRFQLRVWPIPDQAYVLQAQYYILPDYLTKTFPYIYGGAQHTETILESCLAIAEQRLDDAAGVHTAKFLERLAASINADRKQKPQKLGLNLDRSDGQVWDARWRHWDGAAKVNGVQY